MCAEPGQVFGIRNLPAREVRVADVAHLALLDEVVERGERLLDRGQRIGPVQLVQVDPVSLETSKRRFDGDPDVAARAARAPVRAVRALHVHTEFGRQHDLIPAAPERVTHQRLAEATRAAVDVRGVEEGYPGIDCRRDNGIGAGLGLGRRLRSTEIIAAEADGGDPES